MSPIKILSSSLVVPVCRGRARFRSRVDGRVPQTIAILERKQLSLFQLLAPHVRFVGPASGPQGEARRKVDGLVPQTLHSNLRIAGKFA